MQIQAKSVPITISLIVLIVLALSPCSGSGVRSNIEEDTNILPQGELGIAGGTLNEPTSIVIHKNHEISNNIGYNYFKYSANTQEKVFIHTSLTKPLSDTDKAWCSAGQNLFDTQIIAYDSNNETVQLACGQNMLFSPPKNEQYSFYFKFPSHGPGIFNIASTTNNSAITSPSGARGSPSSPRQINIGKSNNITTNSFLNYYQYTANKNDKLVFNVLLDQPLSAQQKVRCASFLAIDAVADHLDTNINVFDSSYKRAGGVCGESLTFTFPETSTYIFQFNFATQSSGIFNAAIIN